MRPATATSEGTKRRLAVDPEEINSTAVALRVVIYFTGRNASAHLSYSPQVEPPDGTLSRLALGTCRKMGPGPGLEQMRWTM